MGSRASRVLNISCGSTLVPDSFGWLAAPGVERSGHAECASRGGTRAPRCQPRETRAQLSRRSSVARATGNDSRPRRSRSPPGSPAPRRPDSATMRRSDRQLTRVALSPQPSRDDSPRGLLAAACGEHLIATDTREAADRRRQLTLPRAETPGKNCGVGMWMITDGPQLSSAYALARGDTISGNLRAEHHSDCVWANRGQDARYVAAATHPASRRPRYLAPVALAAAVGAIVLVVVTAPESSGPQRRLARSPSTSGHSLPPGPCVPATPSRRSQSGLVSRWLSLRRSTPTSTRWASTPASG